MSENPIDTSRARTALVVDDEPLIMSLITEWLEDLGYVCVEAQDGTIALSILQSDIQLDMLVTDLGLPGGLGGRELAAAGRVLRTTLKVLFITGYVDSADQEQIELVPGTRVLLKPFMMEDLQARTTELMDS